MQVFHEFQALETYLISKTKTLEIYLNNKIKKNYLNLQTLEELEKVFTWSANHIEIQSILIKGKDQIFSMGVELEEFRSLDIQIAINYLSRFQKIVYSMLHLPQTIIIDAGTHCHNIASELLLGADIVVANSDAKISFNHLEIGLIPQSGGISLLQKTINQSMARNWLLSGNHISKETLLASGLVHEIYQNEYNPTNLLKKINSQAQLSRIQTKAALLESKRSAFEKALEIETRYSHASNKAEDWKRIEFINPKDFLNDLKNSTIAN